jgi:hypothetical protein
LAPVEVEAVSVTLLVVTVVKEEKPVAASALESTEKVGQSLFAELGAPKS